MNDHNKDEIEDQAIADSVDLPTKDRVMRFMDRNSMWLPIELYDKPYYHRFKRVLAKMLDVTK